MSRPAPSGAEQSRLAGTPLARSPLARTRRVPRLLLAGVLIIAGLLLGPSAAAAAPAPGSRPSPRPSTGVSSTGASSTGASSTGASSTAAMVLGHRGASGYRPEHTLASYRLAIAQCADVIEPDVVPTRDGQLVVRHEPEIGGTTDVAAHPEFADRRTTKIIDGASVTGWFTDDFTLAELRTLRAVERLPKVRPQNTEFDGRFPIPTLAEVLDLAKRSRTCTGRPVGVAPETKHPSYFRAHGLALEGRLVRALQRAGLNSRRAPVYVQSFETANLRRLDRLTPVRLVQLIDCSGAPYDLRAAGDDRSYADLSTARGLRTIARYADYAAFCKDVMIPRRADGRLGRPTRAISNAHRAGLGVIGWTFRRENQFLPAEFRIGSDPNGVGDLGGEVTRFLDAGMDAFFTDNPDLGVAAVNGRRQTDLITEPTR